MVQSGMKLSYYDTKLDMDTEQSNTFQNIHTYLSFKIIIKPYFDYADSFYIHLELLYSRYQNSYPHYPRTGPIIFT